MSTVIRLRWVKRRDPIKQLASLAAAHDLAWEMRPGRRRGPHETFQIAGRTIPIPRHREIGEMLARAIIREVESVIEEAS